MKSYSLRQLEETHESTRHHPAVYKGCLSLKERQIMADIYKEAGLRDVKPNSRAVNRYRKKVQAGIYS